MKKLILTLSIITLVGCSSPQDKSLQKIDENLQALNQDLKGINDGIKDIHNKMVILAKNDSIMADALAHYPNAQPLPMSSISKISSVYNERIDPISKKKAFHYGIDYAAKKGSPVIATGNGVVLVAGWDNGYGNMVKIDHMNGYESDYAHLHSISVKPGQKVKRGDVIGTVGSTGYSTGPHLHYQISYVYKYINPRIFYLM